MGLKEVILLLLQSVVLGYGSGTTCSWRDSTLACNIR